MGKSKLSKAAAELGRKGGAVRSEAKAAAVRANGALGGRPVKLRMIAGVEVHADAKHVGTEHGRPAFQPQTAAAARWLERHGFERVRPDERPLTWIKRS